MKTFINGGKVEKMFIAGNEVKSLFKNGVKVYENTLNDGLILDLPLQNNFTDYSASGISMVAANGNGLPSFVSDGSGGFALDFNGTKSIKTAVNLPVSTSDKLSISFWIKSTDTTSNTILMELGTGGSEPNYFDIIGNFGGTQKISFRDENAGVQNIVQNNTSESSWLHVVIVSDRALGTSQSKIYINKVSNFTQSTSGNVNGNYTNYILYIGQRNGTSNNFKGQIKNLKIWNRILTQSEIENLFALRKNRNLSI